VTTRPAPGSTPQPGGPPAAGGLEASLARVLQVGTYGSMALIAVGAGLLVAGGTSPLVPGPGLDLGRLVDDIAALRPTGFLWLGVIGVLATPGLRVVGALIGFARAGEWRMAAVAAAIILVVVVGIVAGLVTG
jgi:uncharacterized membrane protein